MRDRFGSRIGIRLNTEVTYIIIFDERKHRFVTERIMSSCNCHNMEVSQLCWHKEIM